jgi:hypothetical protein
MLDVLLHEHALTHSLTKPLVQPLKNFQTFYGTRRFITAFTITLHLFLSWVRSIQSTPFQPISLKSILILSVTWRLDTNYLNLIFISVITRSVSLTTAKFNEIFSVCQPCQLLKNNRRFGPFPGIGKQNGPWIFDHSQNLLLFFPPHYIFFIVYSALIYNVTVPILITLCIKKVWHVHPSRSYYEQLIRTEVVPETSIIFR